MERTTEDFLAWTQPNDYEIVGHARSTEEYELLRDFVEQERRDWLVARLRQEVVERTQNTGEDSKETTSLFNFRDVPLTPTITRPQHRSLIDSEALPRLTRYDQNFWEVLAGLESVRQGFSTLTSKYIPPYDSDSSEEYRAMIFERYYKSSQDIIKSGNPIRVIMNGAPYLSQGALDLESVQAWLDGDYDNPRHAHPPLVFKYHWEQVIKLWQETTQALGQKTYGDVVEEVGDGVYFAPYIPDEVMASRQFITFDDVAAAYARRGERIKQGTSRTFKSMLGYLVPGHTNLHSLHQTYGSQSKHSGRSGVVFFAKSKLPEIVEHFSGLNQKEGPTARMAKHILSDYFPDLVATEEQRLYEQLVFGRRLEPAQLVPSYATPGRKRHIPSLPEPEPTLEPRGVEEIVVPAEDKEPAQPPASDEVTKLPIEDRIVSREQYTAHILLRHTQQLLDSIKEEGEATKALQHEQINRRYDAEIELLELRRENDHLKVDIDDANRQLERERRTRETLERIIRNNLDIE